VAVGDEPEGGAGRVDPGRAEGGPGPVDDVRVLLRFADLGVSFPGAAPGRCFTELMLRDNPATNLTTCPGCGASWRGTVRAHCRVCHVTLGDDVLFDAHRLTGRCVHPSSLGLIVQGGVWGRSPVGESTAAVS
jgi:hypothetical protein